MVRQPPSLAPRLKALPYDRRVIHAGIGYRESPCRTTLVFDAIDKNAVRVNFEILGMNKGILAANDAIIEPDVHERPTQGVRQPEAEPMLCRQDLIRCKSFRDLHHAPADEEPSD